MERRTLLKAGLALFAASVGNAWAAAREAFNDTEVNSAMKNLFGADSYQPSDAIKFKAPEIAENGAVVPLTAEYAGEAATIAFFVEENPSPLAASFSLGKNSVANVSTRIKMGKSSMVHAVVQTADGKLLGTAKEVKVTIGGCGG